MVRDSADDRMVPFVGMALAPGGLLIEDVESDGQAVLRLDGDPVGCTVKGHRDATRATLIRVDGEPYVVAGEPEPVGVDRRMAARVRDSRCTHVKRHLAVELDPDAGRLSEPLPGGALPNALSAAPTLGYGSKAKQNVWPSN